MSCKLTICSIGSGDENDLTCRVLSALRAFPLILRTGKHPVASFLKSEKIAFSTLDSLYDEADSFDSFNRAAAKAVWDACDELPICYAVSDAAFDTTVEQILETANGRDVIILPGVSHASRCLALVRKTPSGLRVFGAEDFLKARVIPQENLLITELHSAVCAGECKLRLMRMIPEESIISFIFGNPVTGELHERKIALYEMDRQEKYDHLTAVYLCGSDYLHRSNYDTEDLRQVIHRLRAPGGCPWDREQTHESLLQSLLEESWEFIQAVKDKDTDHMYDELGDVLLQVYMQAEIASQHGTFDIDDVTTAIAGKMIERHPHIFGNVKADSTEDVLTNWEAQKREQRGITTTAQAMKDVSLGLSTMLRAFKIQHKAEKVGFDFPNGNAVLTEIEKVISELRHIAGKPAETNEKLQELLFLIVAVCRKYDVQPDLALASATSKFQKQFETMENTIFSDGKLPKDLTLSEMVVYWNTDKRNE